MNILFFLSKINAILTKNNKWLSDSDIFPTLMWSIGLALLTLLVPLAIAILNDIFQRKKCKSEEFAVLDLHVILDSVLRFKELLTWLALIFMPLFAWEYHTFQIYLQYIIIILWGFGVIGLVKIIYDIYLWVKGNVLEHRLAHLKRIKDCKDLEPIWQSVWKTKNIYREESFFDCFSFTMDRLDEKNYGEFKALVQVFYSKIENRSISLLVMMALPKILDWYFEAWEKKNFKKGNSYRWFCYDVALKSLRLTIEVIERRAFKKEYYPYFIKYFKQHIDNQKEERQEVKGKKTRYYIAPLLKSFYFSFFNNIKDYPDRENIWSEIPKEWKVNKNNYEKYIEAQITWKWFSLWAFQKIQHSVKEYDEILDEVVENLFCDVDYTIWSRVLLFRFSPSKGDKLKSLIEQDWIFGRVGPGTSTKQSVVNAFELAFLLFGDVFTRDNLKKQIAKLNELEFEYTDDYKKETKRKEFLDTFEEMLASKS